MNLEFFIAKRLYSTSKGKRRVSRPAVAIAQWGVTIGLIVMTLSVTIIVGFKQEIRNKIAGFGGHIQITDYRSYTNTESPLTVTDSQCTRLRNIPGVLHAQRYIEKPGLLAVGDEFEGILLKGIGADYDTKFISQHITDGTLPSPGGIEPWIALSRSTAHRLQCTKDDKVNLYFMQGGIKARRVRVAAIYETHLTEMDNILAFSDIETLRKVNGWEADKVSGIEITARYEDIEETRTAVIDAADSIAAQSNGRLCVQTIEEINPALFAWLEALDSTVWIILVLVLGIAGFTMVSGLLILILEKSNLIGILKAVGAQNLSIRKIFLYYACFIIGKGMIIGNIIALALCLLQQKSGLVALDPEMYYMDKVPIEFSWTLVPMNIFMFVLSVAMLIVPSMLISKISPAKAIKFE